MAEDTIILVRHGKPALSRKARMDWRGYREWWGRYDEGGLQEAQKIPKKVQAWADRADLIISSPLRRAIESAQRVTGRQPDIIDPGLVEAALPSPHFGPLRVRPKTWGTFARIWWYLGWSDGMESHRDARLRANKVAEKLENHAAGGKIVFVTAHGWFNRMVKGSLMARGWTCVSQNGDLHWNHRHMVRKQK